MSAATSAVSIYDAMPDDEKRKWEAERKLVREGIRRAKSLPRRDRECLMFLVNLWFYHRNGDGFIHPGATMVANKMECCVRTAKAILGRLRTGGYLVVVGYPKGGRRATWYAVDVGKILIDFHARPRGFGAHWDEVIERSNRLVNRAKEAANRAKIAHGIHREGTERPLPETFDDPSDWREIPF